MLCRLALLRHGGLTIGIPGLPGIDAIGQNVSHGCRVPNGILPCGRGCLRGIQPFGDLAATALLCDQRPIHRPHDLGFLKINVYLWRIAVPCGKIPIAVATVRPGDARPLPCLLSTATPSPFGNLGAFICGHHPLHLGQQFALGAITERIVQQESLRVPLLELFAEEPLMGIVTGQAIR